MILKKQKEIEIKKLSFDSRILCSRAFQKGGHGGHYGGCFSCSEILNVLYNGIMKINDKNPDWDGRDHFVLSKGHAAAMLASVLSIRGFFKKEELMQYGQFNSPFGMHTTLYIPGVEFAAGSLGYGLGFGVGIALGKKKAENKTKVYVLMGDGELDEGSVWESAMAAGKYKLDNLVAIVDRNMCNMEGYTENVMPLEPLKKKWESFGWTVKNVDGHDVRELFNTFMKIPFKQNKPSVVIAKTIKGRGYLSIEGKYKFHSAKFNEEDYNKCIQSLTNIRNKFIREKEDIK